MFSHRYIYPNNSSKNPQGDGSKAFQSIQADVVQNIHIFSVGGSEYLATVP